MVPLPANIILGMYIYMFKLLIFQGYLQEKGSLAIDPEDLNIQHIQRNDATQVWFFWYASICYDIILISVASCSYDDHSNLFSKIRVKLLDGLKIEIIEFTL